MEPTASPIVREADRLRACATLGFAFALSCAASEGKPVLPPEPIPAGHVVGTICGARPRIDGTCGVLLDPFDHRRGCAPRAIVFRKRGGDEEGADAEAVLNDLAEEMRRLERLTDVVIVAAAAESEDRSLLDRRIVRVLDRLVSKGIGRDRFSRAYQPAGAGPGYLRFEPFACDHLRRRHLP